MVKMNYLDFWYESFKISFKQVVEFKSNFYTAVLINITYFLVLIFFSSIFAEVIGDVLGWGFGEFVLFGYLLNVMFDISGFFWYGTGAKLTNQIKTGNINSYLTKSGNQLLLFLFRSRYNTIVFVLFDIILYIPYLIYLSDFIFINVLIGIFILIILIIFSVLFIHFLISFSWLFVELGGFLSDKVFFDLAQDNLRNYPFQIFSKNETLFSILKALPMFYVSILLVPIIAFGDYSGLNDINVLFIFILFFVLLFGIIFNWRYGLKNYEAYG